MFYTALRASEILTFEVCVALKIWINVAKYNVRNNQTRWRYINLYKSHTSSSYLMAIVMEYNIRNGLVRWRISASITVV